MTVELRPFSLSAALIVCQALAPDERKLIEAFTGVPYDADMVALQAATQQGLSWTIASDNVPIAVGGFARQRPGVFRTWFYATDTIWGQHGRPVTEIVLDVVRRMLADGHAHRVETVTLADRFLARRWYERIGLAFESTLTQYGANRENAVMYAVVKQETP